MYKPLADSTLMNMTKKEIIEHLRCAEHNHRVCEEQIEQQYKNCMKLLKEERTRILEDVKKELLKLYDRRYMHDIYPDDIDDIVERLSR